MTTLKFSANLGFLWADRPLPEAIRAAHRAGFDAVECHWPYDVDPAAVTAALAETGLPMLGLNTRPGAPGETGLCALPGREAEARDAIAQAIAYAEAIGARAIHMMAGVAEGPEAQAAFLANLRHARALCPAQITLLVEPLNRHDAPGYFLRTTDQAAALLAELALPGVKLMFDCYHVGRTEGDMVQRLRALAPLLGHIQFAAVPDRGPPTGARWIMTMSSRRSPQSAGRARSGPNTAPAAPPRRASAGSGACAPDRTGQPTPATWPRAATFAPHSRAVAAPLSQAPADARATH